MDSNFINNNTPTTNRIDTEKYLMYFFYILILAFFGLNVFAYLGMLSDYLVSFFKPVLLSITYHGSKVTKSTVETSADVAKLGIDIAASTVTNAIDLGKNVITTSSISRPRQNGRISTPTYSEPIPDDMDSLVQVQKSKGKNGYCYIGEDRGFRSCLKINEDDICMSGNIFPSKELCINPSLREGTDVF